MKRMTIAFVACLSLVTTSLSAKSLVLTLKDNTIVYYQLGGESNPMLRFVDGNIVVNTDWYEFGNIKNFYISDTDDPSGIEHSMDSHIQYDHDLIIIDTNKSLPVNVYTSDGHKAEVYSQKVNDKTLINLSPLSRGAYIVNIGESSLKILKK